jgi:DNA gyrase subunit B
MTGAGGKFDKDSYSFWWTHGVGFQWLMHYQTITATVHSGDGKVYQQEYEKEKRYTQLNKLVRLKRGTIVTFILMKLFYSNNRFSYDTLSV